VVQKSGASYAFGETKLGRGYDSARQFLKENPKVKKEIAKAIEKSLEGGNGE
jgi:hypothetical protein